MKLSKEKSDAVKRWSSAIVYLTAAGLARMENKLDRLKRGLPHLIAEAERTAAYGDRSENAEYKDAKATLRRTYRQIYGIEDKLKRVKLIAPGGNDSGAARLGSTVTVEASDGRRRTFRILGPEESDPARGRISYQSPLGAALIGRKVGDVAILETAGGIKTYRLLKIT